MSGYELLGYVASALVLTTFWMRRMVMLRAVAIASNVAFIAYGFLAGIMPVLLLHALLLPLNLYRVVQSWQERPRRVHAQRTLARRTRSARAAGMRERVRRYLMPSSSLR
jgi:hypothetical protein